MIGTIRKHSKGLWLVIIVATVVSFLFWGVGPSRLAGRGGALGTIYGRPVTQQDYNEAQADFFIAYRLSSGAWPDRNLPPASVEQATFQRLLLERKAQDLGIYVSEDQVLKMANQMLSSFGRNGQPVPIDVFVKQILEPERLGAADFERFVRTTILLDQLREIMGLPGGLVTPQEAVADYLRDRQEYSAQAVFFSASNYLSQVSPPTPAQLSQFYTNMLAVYRLPDCVQVSYVAFAITNYWAQAKAEWAKTNFTDVVEANYQEVARQFPNLKTLEAAKDKTRELLIRQRALADAGRQANDFANAVFDYQTNNPEILAMVARQKGLTVHTTEPFSSTYGPEEFEAPADFTKTAFSLSSDAPFAPPVAGPDAVYVMALDKDLPSEIPALDQIRSRVVADYRLEEATLLAQKAGTNFVARLARQTASGHTFAATCVAAGLAPVALPPFSLSTQELPDLDGRADLDQIKQAAFNTPVGQTTGLVETRDGGFVLYVRTKLPVDQTVMNADLPRFIASVRRAGQEEAFNLWLGIEQSREFRNVPDLMRKASGSGAAQ